MNLALIIAGLALVALPGWTASLGRRLVPREWARLTVASLSVGLVAVHLGLLMTAAPTLLGAVGGHDLARLCHQALSPLTPGGAVVGWLSIQLLARSVLKRQWAMFAVYLWIVVGVCSAVLWLKASGAA